MHTGEIEIKGSKFFLINPSSSLPFPVYVFIAVHSSTTASSRRRTCCSNTVTCPSATPNISRKSNSALPSSTPFATAWMLWASPRLKHPFSHARLPKCAHRVPSTVGCARVVRADRAATSRRLRTEPVSAAIQADSHGVGSGQVLPDRSMLPQRVREEGPPVGVHPAGLRDGVCHKPGRRSGLAA